MPTDFATRSSDFFSLLQVFPPCCRCCCSWRWRGASIIEKKWHSIAQVCVARPVLYTSFCMSASRPSSALKDRRPSTSMGFASGSRPTSASRENALSSSAAEPTLRPPLALLNPSHLRPMSALTSASLSSRPASSMSRSSFSGSRLVALNSNVEGPGSFQGEVLPFLLQSFVALFSKSFA
jgi:hypothetical protein